MATQMGSLLSSVALNAFTLIRALMHTHAFSHSSICKHTDVGSHILGSDYKPWLLFYISLSLFLLPFTDLSVSVLASPLVCHSWSYFLSFLAFLSLSLTTTIKDRLSQQELDAAKEYDQILQEYMDDVGVDLCKGMQPPKSVRIAVKVKEDFGKSTYSFIHLNFSIFQNLPTFLPSSPCIHKSNFSALPRRAGNGLRRDEPATQHNPLHAPR